MPDPAVPEQWAGSEPSDDFWEIAPVGLAEISGNGLLLHVNAAGRAILGLRSTKSPCRSPFVADAQSLTAGDPERTVEWRVGAERTVTVAYRLRQGTRGVVVAFRDITVLRRQQRRVAAVAATAASVASERSLVVSLCAIAREVARADELAGVQVIADDERQNVGLTGLRVIGSAGFPHSDEFFDLLLECRDRGATLKMREAFETGKPVVVRDRYASVMADPTWSPLWDLLRDPVWQDFASIPLIANGRPIGVLNAFFGPGQQVDDDALAFLTTMADQAALAIDYAALLERQRQDAGRAERQRLARELHDSVVQQVFSIGMQTEALKLLATRGDQPSWARVAPIAKELEATTRSVLGDLRSLIEQLHPAVPTTEGLGQALRELVTRTRRRATVEVTLSCPLAVDDLNDSLSEDVYFVIVEAVHNAVKHAQPDAIDITLDLDPSRDELVVHVTDDGRGLSDQPPAADGGYGLTSMRQRAESWRGSLVVAPGDGGGTQVTMRLPMAVDHSSSATGAGP